MMVWRTEPSRHEETIEMFDFCFETNQPTPAELDPYRFEVARG